MLMRVFQADEVIAAVARWPKQHPIAGLAQRFERLHQETRWQGRAVTIDEQNAVMTVVQEIARRPDQHTAEIVANLQLKPERCRKQFPHDALDAGGRINAVSASAE